MLSQNMITDQNLAKGWSINKKETALPTCSLEQVQAPLNPLHGKTQTTEADQKQWLPQNPSGSINKNKYGVLQLLYPNCTLLYSPHGKWRLYRNQNPQSVSNDKNEQK